MIHLRPYQQDVERNIYAEWQKGARNVGASLATGAGKTVVFSKIIHDHQCSSVAIAHRKEIVSQISLALARNGVRHNIIAPSETRRGISALHLMEIGRDYIDPHSSRHVAGVDTLINMDASDPWFAKVGLWVCDEGHHLLRENKWGTAVAMFPNARGLAVSATWCRADGKGLGRNADGVIDTLVEGPDMRQIINMGYLTDYRIFAPASDIDLSQVPISASGDFSPPKLSAAVHKSHIVGDVVEHYLRLAQGKLGVTFAVDVESAKEIATAFRNAGVPAEVVTANTPTLVRASILRRFAAREILQLVNVDLFGEGFDLPAIEVVSMARPTQSYSLYAQQFGRALRIMDGKLWALIIDHVGNVHRHGLPDRPRIWSLDRRARGVRTAAPVDAIPVRTCLQCISVYERTFKNCPYCGFYNPPAVRSSPEAVDGDLTELDAETLERMRKEIAAVGSAYIPIPHGATPVVVASVKKRHHDRQQSQGMLRKVIEVWSGWQRDVLKREDFEIYRRFFFEFGIDMNSAQTLNAGDANELYDRLVMALRNANVEYEDGIVEATVTDKQVVLAVVGAAGGDPRDHLVFGAQQDPKVCLRALERAEKNGLIGRTADWSMSWLTMTGMKLQ